MSKKGKAGKKKVTVVVHSDNESDYASEEEELSMRDMVQNLMVMMAPLNMRMDQMDGGGRKKEKSDLPWHYSRCRYV